MEERIEKLERDIHALRLQNVAFQAAFIGLTRYVPQNRQALVKLIEEAEHISPFQQIPDQDIAEIFANLRLLLASV